MTGPVYHYPCDDCCPSLTAPMPIPDEKAVEFYSEKVYDPATGHTWERITMVSPEGVVSIFGGPP